MSTQIVIEATSSSAPPRIAPPREIRAASSCSFSTRLRDRRPEAERLADGVVPLPCALGAAALRPAGEHRGLDELLVLLGLGGLDRNDGDARHLAHGAGL